MDTFKLNFNQIIELTDEQFFNYVKIIQVIDLSLRSFQLSVISYQLSVISTSS
ncbi:MAG: hypothetical protein SWX82_33395 [Cyanobacteriota bacterium]|nr:hypothetical protein [Cyanobacteriota bacterium]